MNFSSGITNKGKLSKSLVMMMLKELKEFCSDTSIHGLGQIANDKLSILKRLLWSVIFVGSIAYAGRQLVFSIKGIFVYL